MSPEVSIVSVLMQRDAIDERCSHAPSSDSSI